ncbi:cation/H(+) antiporter [Pseudothauera rhizosphaerae]|uniref:Cation/H(+) antiporter n=1 Tax=Pseudothauera rhizosphaerae TaxID=2565932 RepID=A0A4S4B181_9RHOO|nr:cation/H(+) antiporter [Pseudothauera rhizosphaerae]
MEFNPLTLLLLQIAAVLLVSRSLGVVTQWIGQPLVIAEVLAGIVLGPSLLGWLWPEAMATLFPQQSMPALRMLSQVGLVLFMFLVGLEFDPRLLQGRARASVIISHSSIVVPFALGAVAGWWLYDAYAAEGVSYVSFVLFLGVAMSVTAFPVLARILSERNLLGSRVGALTMTCAAVDDVTAWCLLAFVVAVARAHGLEQALWTTVLALAYIALMLKVVRPFLGRLGMRVASREGLTSTVVALILLLLIASSTITEMIGIHALFGAFLFGAILPKEGRLAEMLAEKLEAVAVVLLLPLFFAYSGLRTEIGLLQTPAEWLVALGLIGVASLGKFGGSTLAARLTGMRWREASALGILMNTRGLMELIVLNIGLDLGVISPTVFTMLVVMALVTTFTTTPVLALVYPDRELARDRLAAPPETEVAGAAPFTAMVSLSHSDRGPGLALLAGALAAQRQARVYALHLRLPSDRPSAVLRDEQDADEGPLGAFLRQAGELALAVKPLSFVSAEPATDICRTARAKQASLVLLGAHKPLLLEGSFGGTVSEVLEQAPGTVGVLIDHGLTKIERVLVACAGSTADVEALRLAARIGAAPGVRITTLCVAPPGGGKNAEPCPACAAVPEVAAGMRTVEHASPAAAVLDEVRRGYDLVILGMHEDWGLSGSRFGFRRRTLAESPASILAVHSAEAGQISAGRSA